MQDSNTTPITTPVDPTFNTNTALGSALNDVQNSGNAPYDFNKMLLDGKSPADIQAMSLKYNIPVVFGDVDNAIDKMGMKDLFTTYPKMKEDFLANSKAGWEVYNQGLNLSAYTSQQMIPNTTEGRTLARMMGIQDRVLPTELTLNKIPNAGQHYTYTMAGAIETESLDVIASGLKYFKTNAAHGSKWVPLDEEGLGGTNYEFLKRVDGDLSKGEFESYWQEADQGEIVPTDKIKSLFGDRTLNTPWMINTLGRSIFGAFVGKTQSGIGELIKAAGTISARSTGDIIKFFTGPETDAKINAYSKDPAKWTDVVGNAMVNSGNYMQKRNADEQGTYDTWSSFMYGFGDGIGQIASMIAMGGLAGGAIKGAGMAAGKFGAKLLAKNLIKAAPKVATQVGLIVASAQAGAGFMEEMRAMGVPEQEAAAWFFPFMGATYMSERMIGPNLLTNFWQNGTRKIMKDATVEQLGKKFVENTGKTFAKGTTAEKNYFVTNLFKTVLKSGDKLRDIATKNRVAGAFIAGFEEVGEEWVEDVMDFGIQNIYNGFAKNRADDIVEHYDGITYNKLNNGQFVRVGKDGKAEVISEGVYEAETAEKNYYEKVSNGEGLFDPKIDLVGDTMVFWSALLSGGFAKNLHGQTQDRQDKLIMLASDIVDGKIKKEDVHSYWDDLKAQGGMGQNHKDADGNIIVYGTDKMSQADVNNTAIKGQLDFYIDLITKYGLNSTKLMSGAKGNNRIVTETVKLLADKENAATEIQKLETLGTLTDEQKKRKEELEQTIKATDEQITYNVTPKSMLPADHASYDPNAIKSQKYTEEWNKIAFVNFALNNQAEEAAKKELDGIYGKGNYDQAEIDKVRGLKLAQFIGENPNAIKTHYAEFLLNKEMHTAFTENFINSKYSETIGNKEQIVGNFNDLESTFNDLGKQLSLIDPSKTEERGKAISSALARISGNASINSAIGSFIGKLSTSTVSFENSNEVMNAFKAYDTAWKNVQTLLSDQDKAMIETMIPTYDNVKDLDLQAKAVQALKSQGNNTPSAEEIAAKANEISGYKKITPADLTKDERMKVLQDLLEKTQVTKDINGRSYLAGKPFKEFIEDAMTYVKNPDVVINDVNNFIHSLLYYKKALDTYERYLDQNYKLVQGDIETNIATKEHSPLRTAQNERISKDEYEAGKKLVQDYRNMFEQIDQLSTVAKVNVEDYQHAFKTHYLYNQLLVFTDVWDRTEEIAIKDLIDKAMVNILHILEDNNYTKSPSKTTKDDMVRLWAEYNKPIFDANGKVDSVKTEEKKAELRGINNDIEKEIIKLIDQMSGKLEKVILDVYSEMKAGKIYFENLSDYNYIPLIERDLKDRFSGSMSQYEEGKQTSKDIVSGIGIPDDATKLNAHGFYMHFTLTQLNMINRFGQNNTPKYSEVMRSYKNFLDATSGLALQGTYDYMFTPSYEQMMATMHSIGFVLNNNSVKNSEGKSIYTSDDTGDHFYINSILSLQGYAGAGKTSVVPQHIIGTLLQLQSEGLYKKPTKNLKILFAAINPRLSVIHKENAVKVFSLAQSANPLIPTPQFDTIQIASLKEGSLAGYDLVFFDEGSAYTADTMNIIREEMDANQTTSGGIRGIVMFDNLQVPPEGSPYNYVKSIGERTVPLSEIFRNGIGIFHNLTAVLRSAFYNGNVIYPEGTFYDDKDFGLVGLKWSKTPDEIVANFKTEFDRESEKEGKQASVILLVFDENERQNVLQKLNDPTGSNYGKHVVTIKSQASNENQFSGLSADKVFCPIDFETLFKTDVANEKIRYMITSWSRQTMYLEAISKSAENRTNINSYNDIPGASEAIDVVYDRLTEAQRQHKFTDETEKRNIEVARINYVLDDGAKKAGSTSANTPSAPANTPPNAPNAPAGPDENIGDFRLADNEISEGINIANTLRKSTNIKNTKTTNKATKKNPKGIVNVTDLEPVAKHIVADEQTPVARKRNALYRALLDMSFANKYDIDQVVQLVTDYKTAIETHNKANPSDAIGEIKDQKKVARVLIQQFSDASYTINKMIDNPLVVTNFTLNSTAVDGRSVVGSPAAMELIGFDDQGRLIVNLTDFQFVENSKTGFTPYDIAKAGAYIAMAQRTAIGKTINVRGKNIKISGITVNKYTIVPMKIDRQNHNEVQEKDHIILPIDQMIEGVKIMKDGSIFNDVYDSPAKETLDYNFRLAYDPSGEITVNDVYETPEGDFLGVNYIFRNNGNYWVNYRVLNKELGQLAEPLESFKEKYSVKQRKGGKNIKWGLHKSSAEVYDASKGLYTTSAIFPVTSINVLPVSVQGQFTSDTFDPYRIYTVGPNGKTILNLPLAIRQLFLSELGNRTLTARYNPSMEIYAPKEKGGGYEQKTFQHVLTSEISEQDVSDIIDNLEKGMSSANYLLWTNIKQYLNSTNVKQTIIDMIANNNINIMSVFGKIENGYNTPVDQNVIEQLLKITDQTQAEDFINNYWNKAGNQFEQEGVDYFVELKKLNADRMLFMWKLKNEGPQELGIVENGLISGIPIQDKSKVVNLNYDEFKTASIEQNFNMKDGEFKVSKPNYKVGTPYGRGNVLVTIPVHREGMSTVYVRVHAKPINSAKDTQWKETLKEYDDEIKAIKSAYEAKRKEVIEKGGDLTLLNEDMRDFLVNQVENSRVFKFILANSSTPYMDNTGIKKHVVRDGNIWRLAGKSTLMKINDLEGYLTEVKRIMADPDYMKNPDSVPFRFDMFDNYEDNKVNPDNIVIHYTGLGQPQVFVRNELGSLYNQVETSLDSYEYIDANQAKDIVDLMIGQTLREAGLKMPTTLIKNGTTLSFGRVRDKIISIANLDGVVEKTTPAHETMHYIMLYMLNPDEYKYVMNDIRNTLGEGWDGTTRQLHEYAAKSLNGVEIRAPKNLFEQFIRAIQKIIFRVKRFFNTYRPNLTTLIQDVKHGVFVNMDNSNNNENIDLYNEKRIHKYNSPTALKHIVKIFGSTGIADQVVQRYIGTSLQELGPLSMMLNVVNPTSYDALALYHDTVVGYNLLADDTVEISDIKNGIAIKKQIKVGEMEASDFITARTNIRASKGNAEAVDKYCRYHLSYGPNKSDFTFKVMANRIVPDANIDVILDERARALNETTNYKFIPSEFVSMETRMSSDIRASLSSIPLMKYTERGAVKAESVEQGRNYTDFVPYESMHGILIHFFSEMKQAGVANPSIQDLFDTMYKWLEANKSTLKDSTFYKYVYSFMYKFGDKYSTFKGIQNYKMLTKENGEVVQEESYYRFNDTGLLYLIKNRDEVLRAIGRYGKFKDNPDMQKAIKEIYDAKIELYETHLKGLASFYNSVSTTTLGRWVNTGNGLVFVVKSNRGVDMLKDGYKKSINDKLMNKSGSVKPNKMRQIMPGESQLWEVTTNGIKIIENGTIRTIVNMKNLAASISSNTSEVYIQQMLEWMGLSRNVTLNTLRYAVKNNPDFYLEVYTMMLATKVNAIINSNLKTTDEGSELNFDSVAERTEYESLNETLKGLYKKMGYSFETLARKESKGKVANEEGGLVVPYPDDVWHLTEDLAYAKMYTDSNFMARGEYNVENEFQQIHNPGTTFTDGLGKGSESFYNKTMTELQGRIDFVNKFNEIQDRIDRGEVSADEYRNGTISRKDMLQYEWIKAHGFDTIDSPFVELVGNQYKLVSNPVFTKKVKIGEYYDGSGEENDFLGVPFDKMTPHDMLKTIIEGTYNLLLSGSPMQKRYIPTFFDAQADKGRKLMQGITFTDNQNKPFDMYDYEVQPETNGTKRLVKFKYAWNHAASIIDDFVEYYDKIQGRSIARWNTVLGTNFTEIQELRTHLQKNPITPGQMNVIEEKLLFGKDYYFKEGSTLLGNHTTLSFAKSPNDKVIYTREFINKYKAAQTSEQKVAVVKEEFTEGFKLFHKLIDEVNYFKEGPEGLGKVLQDIKKLGTNTFNETLTIPERKISAFGITIPETKVTNSKELEAYQSLYHKKINEAFQQMLNIYDQNKPISAMNSEEENNARMKERKELMKSLTIMKKAEVKETKPLFNKLYNLVATDLASNDLLNGIFMTFHIYNEITSQLGRGGVLSYTDVIDFIKRAAGYHAPGTVSYTQNISSVLDRGRGLPTHSRMIILKDIPGSNTLFSNKTDRELHTNGLIHVNPLEFLEQRANSGGLQGPVSQGMLKWVNFGNDIFLDQNIYAKAAFNPIAARQYQDNKYYQDLLRMMMGEEIYDTFLFHYNDLRSQYSGDTLYEMAMKQTNDDVNRLGWRHKMVAYAAHESTIKNGLHRVQNYSTTENGLNSISVDPSLNDINKSVTIDNRNMRVQQLVTKSVIEPFKSLPTQLSYLIGLGNNNKQLIERYNTALAEIVQTGINKLNKLETKQAIHDYIRTLMVRGMISAREVGLTMDEMLFNTVSVEVYRGRAMKALISSMNKYLKPSMPGIDMTQAPELGLFYEEMDADGNGTGRLFRTVDMGYIHGSPVADDRQQVQGFKSRPLKPVTAFLVDGNTKTEYTQRDALLKDLEDGQKAKNIRVVAGEIVGKFAYAKEFGIDNDLTLQEVMTLKTFDADGNSVATNLYETAKERALNGKKSYMDYLNQLQDLFGYKLTNKDTNIDREALYNRIVASIADDTKLRNAIRFWETKGQWRKDPSLVEGEGGNVNILLMNMAAYYHSLNNALDVFSTRIPTTLGSSAGTYRYVAFDNSSANTVYTSAEKSLLDGSDYDIDALQIYFSAKRTYSSQQDGIVTEEIDNAIADDDEVNEEYAQPDNEEGRKEMKNFRRQQMELYDYFMEYFNDPLNLRNMLEVTTTDNIQAAGNAKVATQSRVANTIGTGITEMDSNFLGKDMVGHGATMENAIVRITHMPAGVIHEGIQRKFINGNLLALMSEAGTMKAVAFCSEIINGSTDNAKLGGVIGALNINKVTSPLMAGMIASGMSQEEVYALLSNDADLKEIINAATSSYNMNKFDRGNSSRKFRDRIWNVISARLNEVPADDDITTTKLNKFLEFAYTGEMLRRFASIAGIQQGIKADDVALYNLTKDVENTLGMPLQTFLDNVLQIKRNGSKQLVTDNYDLVSDDDQNSSIRQAFDMAWLVAHNPLLTSYISMLNTINNTLKKGFTAYSIFDMKKGNHLKMKAGSNLLLNLTGRRFFDYDAEYISYLQGIDDWLLGNHMSKLPTLQNVQMKYYDEDGNIVDDKTFNLETTQGVVRFLLRFPQYVETLKAKYSAIDESKEGEVENAFNKFIDVLNIDHDSNGYPFVRLSDSIYFTAATNERYRRYFEGLTDEEKNLFYLYQMLYYGMRRRSGSFNEIFSNPYKESYGAYLEDVSIDDRVKEQMAIDIIVKNNLGAIDNSEAQYRNFYDAKNTKRNYTFRIVDGKKEYLMNNYWSSVNTLGRNDVTVANVPPAPAMNVDDLYALDTTEEVTSTGRRIIYRINKQGKKIEFSIPGTKWHGIYRANSEIEPYQLKNGSVADTVDGTRVKVFRDDDSNTTFQVRTLTNDEITQIC